MSGTLAPPTAGRTPAGWYPDPIESGGWRWWDGGTWTAHRAGPTDTAGVGGPRKPRLPRWLSPPVAVCLPLVALALVAIAIVEPIAVVAGAVPLFIVLPAIAWLDRIEPEPRAARVHALLWGATVAITVALIANVSVAAAFGDTAAAVVSAPLAEEAMKGLGIVWAFRRREVDGVTDGIVYAGWVALGFAVVEDVTYFADAALGGVFVEVFVLRALLTPFAHPLFTVWTGIAIGRAASRGRPLGRAVWWGYGLAVLAHAAWNGSLVAAQPDPDTGEGGAGALILLLVIPLFVALFVAVVVRLAIVRRRELQRFERQLTFLVRRYGLTDDERTMFESWPELRARRRALPRRQRRAFDAVHAVIARLAVLHERLASIDPATERVLAHQLAEARRVLDARAR